VEGRLLRSLHEFGRINRRMHNKLFIADNAFAISGGRNVADEYFMHGAEDNLLDLDVLSSGPIVGQLSAVFDRYWNSDLAYPVRDLAAPLPAPTAQREFVDAVRDAPVRLGERQQDLLGNTGLLRQFERGRLSLVFAAARLLADAPEKAIESDDPSPQPTVARQTLDLLATTRAEALILSP
jgi:putative cardiolipin synthase